MAAVLRSTTRTKTESTLWSMVFAGRTRTGCCKYCFILSQLEQHCELLLAQPQRDTQTKSSSIASATKAFQAQQSLICNEWNYNPVPHCPIPRCLYKHTHLLIPCSRNSRIIDKDYKDIVNSHLSGIQQSLSWVSAFSTLLNML